MKKPDATEITVGVNKADIGGWVGHSVIHPAVIESASKKMEIAKTGDLLVGYHVSAGVAEMEFVERKPEPHRLRLEEMKYTTMPQIMKKLEGRWEKAGIKR